MSIPFVVSIPARRRSSTVDDPRSTANPPPSEPAPARRIGADELGILAPWAGDPAVTDLFVNGDRGLWIDRGAGAAREASWSATESEVRSLAIGLVAAGGRHVDEATPCVDVRLRGGVRVHVVLAPIATRGTLVSVRLPRPGGWSLDELAAQGMFDPRVRTFLREAVDARRNILVSGAGGAGKTTLLASLLSSARPTERIVTIEDVAELRPAHPHVAALETRQPNLEGAGGIGLDRLLREALRMRPDRLVVGEVRGAEIRELLSALNTGHDGGAGTIHANSLADVPARMEALGALAGMSAEAIARQAVSAIDLIVHVERGGSGRRVADIGRFVLRADDRLAIDLMTP